MTDSIPGYFSAVATVSYQPAKAYDLGTSRGFARAERELQRLLDRSPEAADGLYLELVRQAGSNAGSLAKILKLNYRPKRRAAIEAMFDIAFSLSKDGAPEAIGMIPEAYRFGRPDIARRIFDNIAAASDDPYVLHQLSTHMLHCEQDDDALVAALSVINGKSPYRVGTLVYQAEFASRQQSREILRNVPPITRAILDELEPGRPIVFLDGGATGSTMEEQFSGWPADRWKVFGFDPHPDADLSVDQSANVQMIRTALGSSRGKLHLFHTRVDGGSSSFRPDLDYIRNLAHGSAEPLEAQMAVVSESDVDVIDLDSWRREAGVPAFDFMKLNVQGGELDILRGATETLDRCLGVQCEVAFVPLYREAPLFRDVDAFMDAAGFTFFDVRKATTNGRRSRRRTPMAGSRVGLFRWPSRHMTEAHVLYLRDPFRPEERDAPRWRDPVHWLRLAVVAEMAGQVGFAMQLCEAVRRDFPDALRDGGAAMERGLDAADSFYRSFDVRNR